LDYYWLPEDKWNKAIGQFRLQVAETLSVFNMYGMGEYIPGAVDEISDLAITLTQKVRGKDKPYQKEKKNPRLK